MNANLQNQGNRAMRQAVNGNIIQARNTVNNMPNNNTNVSPAELRNYMKSVLSKIQSIERILSSNLVMKPKTFKFANV